MLGVNARDPQGVSGRREEYWLPGWRRSMTRQGIVFRFWRVATKAKEHNCLGTAPAFPPPVEKRKKKRGRARSWSVGGCLSAPGLALGSKASQGAQP